MFFMYLFMNINMNFERYIRETKSTKLILIYFFKYPIITYNHILVSFYNTSGANETILVKLNCLNSRAIAPKTRVPFGFPS